MGRFQRGRVAVESDPDTLTVSLDARLYVVGRDLRVIEARHGHREYTRGGARRVELDQLVHERPQVQERPARLGEDAPSQVAVALRVPCEGGLLDLGTERAIVAQALNSRRKRGERRR